MKFFLMLFVALLICVAAPADARTYVVDQSGAGDFTTIQAAIDSLGHHAGNDTAYVHPGNYAEDVRLTDRAGLDALVSTAGAALTIVRSVDGSEGGWIVHGVTIQEACYITMSGYLGIPVFWEGCVFLSSVLGAFTGGHSSNLLDCDFHGPVDLSGYISHLRLLRFHRAPLRVNIIGGDMWMDDCVFEGDGSGTLVTASLSNNMYFRRCQFSDAAAGVSRVTSSNWMGFDDCRFTDLGIGVLAPELRPGVFRGGVTVDSCDFQRCGRAVSVHFIDGSPGSSGSNSELYLTNSTVTDCADGGVLVTDASGAGWSPGVVLINDRFEQCGGTAVSVVAKTAQIRNSAFFANGGAGIDLTLTSTATANLIQYNTLAFNLGDGLSIKAGAGGLPPGLTVTRNISAQNGGAGFRYASTPAGLFVNNDAWQNYDGGYVGVAPGATNQSLDPRFCDLANGVLTLSAGSPFATVTNPMGAYYGVGCDQELLAAPPSAPALAFAVRPSPARGSVEFALPAGASGARVEVLDAQGRRLWSADVTPGARAVRWQGELDRGGAAGAGVYWARLTGAGETQARRFVWLK